MPKHRKQKHKHNWIKVRLEYSRPDSSVESWYVRCSICSKTDYKNYRKGS